MKYLCFAFLVGVAEAWPWKKKAAKVVKNVFENNGVPNPCFGCAEWTVKVEGGAAMINCQRCEPREAAQDTALLAVFNTDEKVYPDNLVITLSPNLEGRSSAPVNLNGVQQMDIDDPKGALTANIADNKGVRVPCVHFLVTFPFAEAQDKDCRPHRPYYMALTMNRRGSATEEGGKLPLALQGGRTVDGTTTNHMYRAVVTDKINLTFRTYVVIKSNKRFANVKEFIEKNGTIDVFRETFGLENLKISGNSKFTSEFIDLKAKVICESNRSERSTWLHNASLYPVGHRHEMAIKALKEAQGDLSDGCSRAIARVLNSRKRDKRDKELRSDSDDDWYNDFADNSDISDESDESDDDGYFSSDDYNHHHHKTSRKRHHNRFRDFFG